MLIEADVDKLATKIMGWHMAREFCNNEYIPCWVSAEDDFSVPVDFWNPDSDMSDAFMIVRELNKLAGTEHAGIMNIFEGFLAYNLRDKDCEELSMRPSIFKLTPESICIAALSTLDKCA